MSQVSFFALYSNGAKYQAIYDGSTWLRDTTGQKMSVPWRVGEGTFIQFSFDYEPPKGLRACDWAENSRRLNAHLALFTPPQRPATEPPILQSEPDTRTTLLPREPGESRLQQLQRSVGMNEIRARADRQRDFQEQTAQASQPTARQLAAAAEIRRLNNFHARQMKPRGGGGGFGEGFLG
jgi:hypothetical protein